MVGDNSVSDEVALTRMEGKIDRINDRLESGQKNMVDLSTRCTAIEVRVSAIEAKNTLDDGVQKGERRMLTLVIGLASICGMSGLAAAGKILFG